VHQCDSLCALIITNGFLINESKHDQSVNK
jgi:hypothetical protein